MSILSFMITILGILFWIFRFIVCLAVTLEIEFICEPLNTGLEIGVLFATIPCFVFVLKRNIIGAASYMALYVSYFGTALYNTINQVNPEQGLNVANQVDMICSIVGIAITVLTFIDILFNKHRKAIVGGHKKTDWYYNESKYDRQFDERADRNQYKIK